MTISKPIFFTAVIGFFLIWFTGHDVNWFALYSDYWHAPTTMLFGSFVAGSTPLGGGAVSFPVFSKLLEVTAYEARSFGFLIQSIGMSFATLLFICWKVQINWRQVLWACIGSAIGLSFGLAVFSYSDSIIKLAFSLFALLSGLLLVSGQGRNKTLTTGASAQSLLIVGLIGGLLSSQIGAGADTILFFFLVLFTRQEEKISIPTSVAVMAFTAIVGSMATYYLHPEFITPFVINSWLAAAPIVAIGAPLGGWVMSRLNKRPLIILIKVVLLLEASSTLLFVQLPLAASIMLASLIGAAVILLIRLLLSTSAD